MGTHSDEKMFPIMNMELSINNNALIMFISVPSMFFIGSSMCAECA